MIYKPYNYVQIFVYYLYLIFRVHGPPKANVSVKGMIYTQVYAKKVPIFC